MAEKKSGTKTDTASYGKTVPVTKSEKKTGASAEEKASSAKKAEKKSDEKSVKASEKKTTTADKPAASKSSDSKKSTETAKNQEPKSSASNKPAEKSTASVKSETKLTASSEKSSKTERKAISVTVKGGNKTSFKKDEKSGISGSSVSKPAAAKDPSAGRGTDKSVESANATSTSQSTAEKELTTRKIVINKKSVSETAKKLPKPKGPFIVLYAFILAVALVFTGVYFFRPDIWNEGVTRFDDFLFSMGIRLEVEIDLEDEPETEPDTELASETRGKSGENSTGASPANTASTTPSSKDVLSKSGTSKPLTAENLSLYFGNPTDATVEVKNAKNYLVEKVQFSMSYNSEKLIPNWVMWHLAGGDVGSAERGNDFRPDETLPKDFYAVKKADYQYMKYGFDRGHVCPSADRTSSAKDNSETFLMTNMIPQSPNCNRNVWKNLEAYERSLALSGNELYIIAGPYGKGGTSDRGSFKSIKLKNGQQIEVPSHCWKIIMILPEGKNDVSRVNEDTKVLAAFIPNDQECASKTWDAYITNVDYIEEKTSYDFFAILEDSIEDAIEESKYVL